MNHNWINKQNNDAIILFFNGWGMNHHIAKHLECGTFDVLEFDSYQNDNVFDYSSLAHYQKVYIIGWSMGVWYAAQEDFSDLNVVKKIAICGTCEPISDTYGIPEAIFYATAENISGESLEKFARRTMGSKVEFEHLLSLPSRSLECIKAEIKWWINNYRAVSSDFWDVAMVGEKDAIIPPANQLSAWQVSSAKITKINCPHYPFGSFESWEQIIDTK